MIVIRDAVENDVEGIARVHVQAWRESYAGFLSGEALAGLSVEERAAMWRGAFRNPNKRARTLVAESEGDIVGFARGGPASPSEGPSLESEAEIYAIYLLGTIKRQGVGLRLMRDLFSFLKGCGFPSVGLWVLKDNLPSRRFYESLGGTAGAEQSFDLRGTRVVEIAYRFDLLAGG